MSIGTTSKPPSLAAGLAFDVLGNLQTTDPAMALLLSLQIEQLRQLTKIATILSATSGISVSDDDVDIPNF